MENTCGIVARVPMNLKAFYVIGSVGAMTN